MWWGCLDLNQGPIGYEPTALTTELHPRGRLSSNRCEYIRLGGNIYNRSSAMNIKNLPTEKATAQVHSFFHRLTDMNFLGQVLFVVLVLLISWSGIKTI